MGFPHVPRLLCPPFHKSVCPFRFFSSFRASFKQMTISISDATLVSTIHAGPWWRHRGVYQFLHQYGLYPDYLRGVLRLNFYLFIPLLTGCINGYNSSLVNGRKFQHLLNAFGVSDETPNRIADSPSMAAAISQSTWKDARYLVSIRRA